jgi:hypothetical protein
VRSTKLLPLLLIPLIVLGTAAVARAAQVWELYTYGNGELLASAFQGIAFFASNGLQGALKLAAVVALLAALFYAVPMALGLTDAIMAIPHVLLTTAIVGILCSPSMQVQVMILDRVALSVTPVPGVPFPVAAIGYLSSAFGEQMAEKLETAMYPVDYYGKFTESGLGWGPQVVQATLDVNLLDMNLAADLDTYIRVCVIPDIPQYKSVDKILKATTADDMLGNTNDAIPVLLPSQCGTNDPRPDCSPPPADQRCPDAWITNLNPRLGDAAQDPAFLQVLGQQIGKPNTADVLPAIDETAQDLLRISTDSVELLKLRFAANQFLPSLQANAALGGQNGLLTAWSLSAAEAQQTSSWLTAGLMIQQILPYFHATLEFLFFGFLIFGIPILIVMPSIAYHIFATALWLQLWPLAYVFANRILYMQAVKAGLYSDTMNWGMSLAAGQPISTTLNFAYAASGYPIMIGVLLLGGMIYGGQFTMTKALTHGPWQAGAGYGTDLAIGNSTIGGMGYGQRNLAPNTTLQEPDAFGNNSIVETAGDRGHPVIQTITNASGRHLEKRDAGGRMVLDHTTPESDRMIMGPRGLAVEDPNLSLQASEAEVARESAAASTSLTNAIHSEQRASVGIMESSNELFTRLGSQQLGTDDARGQGLHESLTHSWNQNVGYALRHALAYGNEHTESDTNAMLADASLGVKFLGLGVGGGLSFQATTADGRSKNISLDENQAREFNQSLVNSFGRDDSWQHTLRESESYLKSHGLTFQSGETTDAVASAGRSRQAAQTAQTGLEHAQQVSTAIQANRVNDMARVYWDEHFAELAGNRSLDRAYHEMDPREFKALFHNFQQDWQRMVLDPHQADYRAHLATLAAAEYPQDSGRSGQTLEAIATAKAGQQPPQGAPDLERPVATPTDLRPSAPALRPEHGMGEPLLAEHAGGGVKGAGVVPGEVERNLDRNPADHFDSRTATPDGDRPVMSEPQLQSAQHDMAHDAAPRDVAARGEKAFDEVTAGTAEAAKKLWKGAIAEGQAPDGTADPNNLGWTGSPPPKP